MAKADALAPDATLQAVEAAKQLKWGLGRRARPECGDGYWMVRCGPLVLAPTPRQGERGRGRAELAERRRYCCFKSCGRAQGPPGVWRVLT